MMEKNGMERWIEIVGWRLVRFKCFRDNLTNNVTFKQREGASLDGSLGEKHIPSRKSNN